MFELIRDKLQEHLKRSDERITARTDEDYDEEVEEDLQNDDEEDAFVLQKIRLASMFKINFQLILVMLCTMLWVTPDRDYCLYLISISNRRAVS